MSLCFCKTAKRHPFPNNHLCFRAKVGCCDSQISWFPRRHRWRAWRRGRRWREERLRGRPSRTRPARCSPRTRRPRRRRPPQQRPETPPSVNPWWALTTAKARQKRKVWTALCDATALYLPMINLCNRCKGVSACCTKLKSILKPTALVHKTANANEKKARQTYFFKACEKMKCPKLTN